MKLAVSNIAWPHERDADVAEWLSQYGVHRVEIAPTKIWPDPTAACDADIDAYRRFWTERSFEIVAAQSLLFGKPQFTLFDNNATREATLEYLRLIIRLCARLGAKSLVFGSPKNRLIGKQDRAAVWPIAIEFFTRLGEIAVAEGTCVVLEANPPAYGADFIVRAAEAIELVRAVNHPGFRLHLDTACMTLAGDPPAETIADGLDLLRHFHVSEAQLAAVGAGTVQHQEFAAALRTNGYGGWVSIEMRENQPFDINTIAAAVELSAKTYE